MCIPCFFTISTAEVGIIERFGKYTRLAQPGLGCVIHPYEQLVGKLSFRVNQLDVRVETKTLDNVFLTAMVSVQYQILRDNVYEAYYSLSNPTQQITAHVYDVMRSQLPTLELDSVFEAKEDLALAVKNALSETMTGYGYQILQALITDLDPDQRVKNAMNEINSSKRLKFAVAERAEGDKIIQVKSAEAEAEAKYLSGVGVAKQRKAIVDGLRSSVIDFSQQTKDASTKEVMDLLLLTQYFDMVRDVGSSNVCKTTFVPSSASSSKTKSIGNSNNNKSSSRSKKTTKTTTSKKTSFDEYDDKRRSGNERTSQMTTSDGLLQPLVPSSRDSNRSVVSSNSLYIGDVTSSSSETSATPTTTTQPFSRQSSNGLLQPGKNSSAAQEESKEDDDDVDDGADESVVVPSRKSSNNRQTSDGLLPPMT